MSRLWRVLLPVGAALMLGSCAIVQNVMGQVASNSTVKGFMDSTAASPEMKEFNAVRERCAALEKLPVTLKEELAFGGAMAVGVARQGSGLYLEVKGTLEDVKKGKKPQLPPSAINNLTRYLDVVGKNLAAQSSRPTLPWTFAVIDSDSLNAFSAPGGYVFVTRGLLRKLKSEAQLAGVLAHEIAHITEGHAIDSYRKTKAAQCAVGAAKEAAGKNLGQAAKLLGGALASDVDRLSPGAAAALRGLADARHGDIDLDKSENFEALNVLVEATINFVVNTGFGPDSEFAADREAESLVVNAGYNPNEYIAFLETLPDAGLFSSHPPARARQERLREHLTKLTQSALVDASHPFDTYAVVPLKDELAAAAR